MNTPSRRDRLRPLEYLVLAGIAAVFIGLVVLATTREPILALVFFGITFIVTLMTLALLAMSMKKDEAEKLDLHDQDRDAH